MNFKEVSNLKISFNFNKKFLLALPFLIGAMLFLFASRALALCSDPGCVVVNEGSHVCAAIGSCGGCSSPSEGGWNLLVPSVPSGQSNPCNLGGENGNWCWFARWSGACGDCCGSASDPGGCACAPCIPCGCGFEALGPENQYFAEDSQQQEFSLADNSANNSEGLIKEPVQESFSAGNLTASIFSWAEKVLEVFFSWIEKLAYRQE